MGTKKMSLANIQGKLSRAEMKNMMAVSESAACTADGQSCPLFGRCCNECRATFKCGKAPEPTKD